MEINSANRSDTKIIVALLVFIVVILIIESLHKSTQHDKKPIETNQNQNIESIAAFRDALTLYFMCEAINSIEISRETQQKNK